MAVLMEQGADPRHIPGSKRRLEGREPVFGRTPGLLRGLKLKEGMIEIVHLGPLRATSPPEDAACRIMDRQFDRCPRRHPATGVRGCRLTQTPRHSRRKTQPRRYECETHGLPRWVIAFVNARVMSGAAILPGVRYAWRAGDPTPPSQSRALARDHHDRACPGPYRGR